MVAAGEHIAVVWNRLNPIPSPMTRDRVSVLTSPPKVSGRPGPASSMRTTRIFGASFGSLDGTTRWWYSDSCIVRPAMLADGVGGKGRVSCGCIRQVTFLSVVWGTQLQYCPR
jgi:hypothetical protein